jgi:hypothetical protein
VSPKTLRRHFREGDAGRRDRLFPLAGGDVLLVIGATDALRF